MTRRRLITRHVVAAPSVCPTCKGEGVVCTSILDELDGDPPYVPCPDCRCVYCGGTARECEGGCDIHEDAMQVRRDDR